MSHGKTHLSLLVLGFGLLTGCGRDTYDASYKMAGVGLDPEEIEAAPADFGGIIEYDWVDIAGGGIPLGILGLVSYESAGPNFGNFAPPYAMVYGLGFVMQDNLTATDTLFGTFGTAPAKEGTCVTNLEPQAYLSNIVDVGDGIHIESLDGEAGYTIGRRPLQFGPNVENVFAYYMELGSWQPVPSYYYAMADDGEGLGGFEKTMLRPSNFKFGTPHSISFDGSIPPDEATWGAIPVPLSAYDDLGAEEPSCERTMVTPTRPEGVMLSWEGPTYNQYGEEVANGVTSTCLQFQAHENVPESPEACATLAELPEPDDLDQLPFGQMYTGPWDTEGGVTFEWMPSEAGVDEVVTISVRFLGPVDEDDEYKQLNTVAVSPSDDVKDSWEDAQDDGLIPNDIDVPDGYRTANACDDDDETEWIFDPSLSQGNGEYVVSLQGDPSHSVAEVTCRVTDSDGTFTITEEMLETARIYGTQMGAEGAVFYMARTTILDLETPPVRDQYGDKHVIEPVRVVSNAVQLGRFWFDQ